MSAALSFSAGRLYWGAVRDAVSRCKFDGYEIEMWEGRGFLSRDFRIKGDAEAVTAIHEWLKRMEEK